MWATVRVRCPPRALPPLRLASPSPCFALFSSRSQGPPPPRSDNHHLPRRVTLAVPPPQNRRVLRSRASLFTQLRTAARRADIRKATELMDKILDDKLSPNLYAFNDLLLACAKTGQVAKAFKTYNTLKKHGLEPNQERFNYLINACGEAKGEGQFLERALWLKDFEMPRWKIQMRRSTYNVLLKCIARHAKQLDMLHAVLAEMKERGLRPDLTTYTTVISAMALHGDAIGAMHIWDEINENGLEPDMRLYNAMLHALSKGSDSEMLAKFFKQMRKAGFAPDVRTFSIMLRDAYQQGDYDRAVTFLAEIQRSRVVPDVDLCNALLRVGARAEGGRALVSKVIALMRKHKLEFTADIHHTLIAAYAILKEPDMAIATFNDMKQRGFRPTQKAYTSLLVACREAKDPERAMEIYRTVLESDTPPDTVFMRILRQTLNGRPDLLREVQMQQRKRVVSTPAAAAPESGKRTSRDEREGSKDNQAQEQWDEEEDVSPYNDHDDGEDGGAQWTADEEEEQRSAKFAEKKQRSKGTTSKRKANRSSARGDE